MSFILLQINNLRNLVNVKLTPSKNFNLLYGNNGSGKTSFLEAIYYMGLGRSFRSHINHRIIHHDAKHLSLFANISQEDNILPIGLERQKTGELKIRMNKENLTSIFEITKILPIQILNSDSLQLLSGSSKIRRRFIDWGVFHVEHSFISAWQHAQRALKQRNAALKSASTIKTIAFWDAELDTASEKLNIFRKMYLTMLEPILSNILTIFFENPLEISFKYKPGWDEEIGLKSTLKRALERDIQLGFTQYGPHKADLLIRINKTIPVKDIFSQGQQKLLVYALYLAQGMLLKEQIQKKAIFLLDDLPAELDVKNRERIAHALTKIDAQVFITGIDRNALSMFEYLSNSKLFHVEHGQIEPL